MFLKSDFVSGPISVGVRLTLPVEGVSLLLGSDLAGEKVMATHVYLVFYAFQTTLMKLLRKSLGCFLSVLLPTQWPNRLENSWNY